MQGWHPDALWRPLTGSERSRGLAEEARGIVAQMRATGARTAYGMGRRRTLAQWVTFAEIHERLARGEV